MHKQAQKFINLHSELQQNRRKTDRKNAAHESKIMRENLSEEQIDKTLKDSFPASDPPGTY